MMKNGFSLMRLAIMIATASSLMACANQGSAPLPAGSSTPMAPDGDIPLADLLKDPSKYDQKRVRVVGFASVRFEGQALYVTEEDYKKAMTKSAVWLAGEMSEDRKKLHEKVVVVEGTFDAKSFGHLKLYAGTITKIDRLELHSK